MSAHTICEPATTAPISIRSAHLAERLEQGARELADFARSLTDAEWQMTMPGDGRPVGVIVHHVATVYPLEVHLAQMMASGMPIVGVTWDTVHHMNAEHAAEQPNPSRAQTLALLEENSAAAAQAVCALTEAELDTAVPVSLYGDAVLTSQFMLEDHAVRHSRHHLSRLRAAVERARATT